MSILYFRWLCPAQKMKFFLVQQKQHFEFEKAKYLSFI
ncbi:hypothetical protein N499_1078 [Wolbachia pipientis wVitA]|nr:hypothetical protein N500_0154 [Wolbachia pipientis wUni]ONI57160.1 hypothetical protein N499_1078 [Wolbachia pipientis wVitA]